MMIHDLVGQLMRSLKLIARSLVFLWSTAPSTTVLLLIGQLLQGLAPALSVWIIKQVVDTVSAVLSGQIQIIQTTLIGLLAAWIIALLMDALVPPWASVLQGDLNEKLMASIHLELMQKANSLEDISSFEDPQFYDRLQLLRQEADQKPFFLLLTLGYFGKEVATTATMIGLLVSLAWWIPPLLLIAAIPHAFITMKLEGDLWQISESKSLQVRRMDYYSSISLTDTHAKEVRLLGLGDFLLHRYRHAFSNWHKTQSAIRVQRAGWSSLTAIVNAIVNAGIFAWIVQQALQGRFTPGSVLLFIQTLSYIEGSITNLAFGPVSMYESFLYMQKFFEFIDTSPKFSSNTLVLPLSPVAKGIQFNQIRSGETIALVGENGSGKTTLIKLLTRLYDPTEGTILVDEQDLRSLNLPDWRQQIAVVFQDFGRYAFTLAENVELGDLRNGYSQKRLNQAIEQAGIDELCQQLPLGAETFLGKQFEGTELSGGQWQKLAIARAFYRQDAQLLILDEPTAALDPRSEYEIYQQFVALTQSRTTILVTHRLASVRMADRIFVLKQGRLIEQGTHEELLRQEGEYAALWTMQADQYQTSGSGRLMANDSDTISELSHPASKLNDRSHAEE
jgi:ATP-binding cassette, subfamily B, bacterial